MKQIGLSFLFPLLFFSIHCSGQVTIRGQVTDTESNPVPFANIYIDNSGFGAQADDQGKYSFEVSYGLQVDLVASSVGFNPKRLSLNTANIKGNIDFVLSPKLLNEVVVSAKRNGKAKRYWKIFEKGFLGQTWVAQKSEILNPEAISLKEDQGNILASASETIIVENRGLGYRVYVDLAYFKTDAITTFMSAQKRFESLDPVDERENDKWQRGRIQIYNSSLKKFLVQLSQDATFTEFDVYKMQKSLDQIDSKTSISEQLAMGFLEKIEPGSILKILDNKQSGNFQIVSDKPLLILAKNAYDAKSPFDDAPYRLTQLVLRNGSATFDRYGWVIIPNQMLLKGLWGYQGVADQLPREYLPEGTESIDILDLELAEVGKKTILPDTTQVLEFERDITYQANEIMLKSEEQDEKFTADYVYTLKETDQDLPLLSVIRRIPGVRIMSQPNSNGTEDYAIVISGGNDRPATIMYNGIIYESNRAFDLLNELRSSNIEKISLVKYDRGYFGVRGGGGVIVIYSKGFTSPDLKE